MAAPLLRQQLIAAQTAQDTVALVPDSLSGQFIEYTLYIEFSAGAAAGSVVLETAWDAAYAGTWANIGTVAWSAASKAHYVSVTGVFSALRVRIASAITTGTINAYIIAAAKN